MNEAGVSLTVIGVIATLISILFAGAAFYVSHKRRIHQTNVYHVPGTATPPPSPQAQGPAASPMAATSAASAEKPLFKKLSTGGRVDPSPVDKQQPQVYVWE